MLFAIRFSGLIQRLISQLLQPKKIIIKIIFLEKMRFWNREATKCLLENYKKYSGYPNHWMKITDALTKQGFQYTDNGCRDRYNYLFKSFKKCFSGESSSSFQYYDHFLKILMKKNERSQRKKNKEHDSEDQENEYAKEDLQTFETDLDVSNEAENMSVYQEFKIDPEVILSNNKAFADSISNDDGQIFVPYDSDEESHHQYHNNTNDRSCASDHDPEDDHSPPRKKFKHDSNIEYLKLVEKHKMEKFHEILNFAKQWQLDVKSFVDKLIEKM